MPPRSYLGAIAQRARADAPALQPPRMPGDGGLQPPVELPVDAPAEAARAFTPPGPAPDAPRQRTEVAPAPVAGPPAPVAPQQPRSPPPAARGRSPSFEALLESPVPSPPARAAPAPSSETPERTGPARPPASPLVPPAARSEGQERTASSVPARLEPQPASLEAVPRMAALETALRWVTSPEPTSSPSASSRSPSFEDTSHPPPFLTPQVLRPTPTGERPAVSPAPSSAPASEPSRSVHIGSLEVRLEPLPSTPQRPAPAPPAAPRSRAPLARGFTSSFGLKQE